MVLYQLSLLRQDAYTLFQFFYTRSMNAPLQAKKNRWNIEDISPIL